MHMQSRRFLVSYRLPFGNSEFSHAKGNRNEFFKLLNKMIVEIIDSRGGRISTMTQRNSVGTGFTL